MGQRWEIESEDEKMQRKKSRFLVFILSFIPGAGEMYMGFMKMGLSLMLGFMILTAIVSITNLGALSIFAIAMYAYSFFHANNLATLDDRAFHNIRDEYLFGFDDINRRKLKLEGRNRKIAAVILIALGVMMLWQVAFNVLCDIFGWDNWFLSMVYYFVRDELPRAIVGIAVIWGGLALIRGKRVLIEEEELEPDDWNRDEGQEPGAEEWRSDRWSDGSGYGERNGQMTVTGNAMNGQRPVCDVQPVADGRIIYGQGPVEGTQNMPENRK